MLVASDRRRIERYARQAGGRDWVLTSCSDPDGLLALASIDCSLPLSRVYRKVDLPERPRDRRGPL